ncbi:MAG: SCO family protein [Planctomycetes bacterium]|nr:SCO family protein [Planctomycetota bacterium]
MKNLFRRLPGILFTSAFLGILAFFATAREAVAQERLTSESSRIPRQIDDSIDIVEHLSDKIPLDITFVDDEGNDVRLGDYFGKDKPVLITMNYYTCEMLCTTQLNELAKAIADLELKLGKDFEVLTVSVDPKDTTTRASVKKANILAAFLKEPEAREGWHFLTSKSEDDIRRLAKAVGFGYKWDEVSQQYIHAAFVVALTPEGAISAYVYMRDGYDKINLRYTLVDAGQGKIGSTMDRILVYCFLQYEAQGEYSASIMKITQVFGMLTLFFIGGWFLYFWRKSRKNSTDEPDTPLAANRS